MKLFVLLPLLQMCHFCVLDCVWSLNDNKKRSLLFHAFICHQDHFFHVSLFFKSVICPLFQPLLMNLDPSGDSRLSLHCPTSQTSWMGTILPEWGLFWSQCAIVLDRTHILGHSSPSSLWRSDGRACTGRGSVQREHLGRILHGASWILGDSGYSFWLDMQCLCMICEWKRMVLCYLDHLNSHFLDATKAAERSSRLTFSRICWGWTCRKKKRKKKPEASKRLIMKHCIPWCHPTDFPYSASFIKSCIVSWLEGVNGI